MNKIKKLCYKFFDPTKDQLQLMDRMHHIKRGFLIKLQDKELTWDEFNQIEKTINEVYYVYRAILP